MTRIQLFRLLSCGLISASLLTTSLLIDSGPKLDTAALLSPTAVGIAVADSGPADDAAVHALVTEAVVAALGPGGFSNLIHPTQKVFIKINANYGAVPSGVGLPGYLTDRRVVRAVASLVAEIVPPEQIKVGEGISHIGTHLLSEFRDGGYDVDLDGYLDGVPGVQMVCLNEPHNAEAATSPAFVTHFTGAPNHQRADWYIPNVVAEADIRISIPVLKTHDITGLTAAMKNSIGIVPADIYFAGSYSRNFEVRLGLHGAYPRGPAAAVADINAVVPYHFSVVDALTAHRWGPWNPGPDLIYPHAIVAGRDAVAVDTVLASVIGWDPTSIDYLVYGQNDGTGVCDSGYINVYGRSVSEFRQNLTERFPGKIPFPLGFGSGTNGGSGSRAVELEPPWVNILVPEPNQEVSGTINIQFDAGDNRGIAKARLLVDGAPVAWLPYPGESKWFQWDSTSVSTGNHTLTVTVYDAAFNEASASVTVDVQPAGTPSDTPTATLTPTQGPLGTPTNTAVSTSTATPTATDAPNLTQTHTIPATPTQTWSPIPTETSTRTPSPTPTVSQVCAVTECFEVMPIWANQYESNWGSGSSYWQISGEGYEGSCLYASRSSRNSAVRVYHYPITPFHDYRVSIYVKTDDMYSHCYWMETAYWLGAHTGMEFDQGGGWTLIHKFDGGCGGYPDGNLSWQRYESAIFNSGPNGILSIGFKLGASDAMHVGVSWDQLHIEDLTDIGTPTNTRTATPSNTPTATHPPTLTATKTPAHSEVMPFLLIR